MGAASHALTLHEAIDAYLAERRKLGYCSSTNLRWNLLKLLRASRERLGREPLASEVLGQDVEAVLAEGLAKGYVPATRFETTLCLRKLCRWLFRKGILLLDPLAGMEVRRPPRPLLPVPAREDVARLLTLARPEEALARAGLHGGRSAPPASPPGPSRCGSPRAIEGASHHERIVAMALRERAVLELLYGSGLRIGEVRKLDVSDLSLAERTLLVCQAKGRKDRIVPVTRGAARALTRYLSQGREVLLSARAVLKRQATPVQRRALFLTIAGARINGDWQQKHLAPLFRLAGFPGRTGPHRLRHACALHLLESGASIVSISRLLGHASLQSTTIYLRLSTESLRRTLMAAHPRERQAGGTLTECRLNARETPVGYG